MVWPFSSRSERLRRKAADWLARLRGTAGAAERAAFQRWYNADPDHAEAFDRVQAIYGAAGRVAATETGRQRGLPERTVLTRPGVYAAAGGVALLLLSGVALFGSHGLLNSPAQAETLSFSTGIGEIREVPLPDGSRVTLDTKTAVEVELRSDLRQVTLQEGRARFAVAGADERPFVVRADRVSVRAADATFDVSVAGGQTLVQPLRGAVSVEPSQPGNADRAVQLAPGQAVLLSPGEIRVERREPERQETLWPTGMIEFDNAPLDRAVAEANRYSRQAIRLGDPALARLRVTGTFRAGDVQGLARSLEAAFDLRLERSGGGFVLQPGRPRGNHAD